MAYRNKTFVSFASEDIHQYRLMQAWHASAKIDFNFHDAHDLNTARDTSSVDTIRRRLRERLANTKQVVMLIGDKSRAVAADTSRYFHYEVETIQRMGMPVVFANLNGSREIDSNRLPQSLLDAYTISVSFQPKMIKFALDNYVTAHSSGGKSGPHYYEAKYYQQLGL